MTSQTLPPRPTPAAPRSRFFWIWFIHFCQDVVIFSFMAIGAVTADGM